MKNRNRNFKFFSKKKKKQEFPSLKALRLISFVTGTTGTALALRRALEERIKNLKHQQIVLQNKKQAQSEEAALIIASFIGGAITGAISALLLTPESGGDLRQRIAGYFGNDNGSYMDVEEMTKKAEDEVAEAEKKVNGKV